MSDSIPPESTEKDAEEKVRRHAVNLKRYLLFSFSHGLCRECLFQLKQRYGALPNQKELMQRRLRGDAGAQIKKYEHAVLHRSTVLP